MKHKHASPKLYRALSIPATILICSLAYVLPISNPLLLLIIPVGVFTYLDGYIGGILSGLVALIYSLHIFSAHGQLFAYTTSNLEKVIAVFLACATVVFLIGKLKKKELENEQKNKELDENFFKILNAIDMQLMVTDPDNGHVLFANNRMNVNYDVDIDPIGSPCWKVYQRQDEPCGFCPLAQLYKNPETPIEWTYFNPITNRWYHNRELMIPWTDGRLVHLQQGVDITDSQKTESILLERLRQQELMSTLAQSFISTENTKTLIYEALKSTGEFLGIDRVSLYHITAEGVAACKTGWYSHKAEKPLLNPGGILLLQQAFLNKNQPYIACGDVQADPLLYPFALNGTCGFIAVPIFTNHELWGILGLEVCRAPRPVTKSNLYLAQMIGSLISGVVLREKAQVELRTAKERAEESAIAKTNFLATMSHEIRTPINVISGMAQLAQANTQPQRTQHYFEKISDAATHLLGIINDILDMSKIDAGKLELSNTDFTLDKMLQTINTVTGFKAKQKHQSFTVQVDDAVPASIVADQQHLTQVLTNLISNAIKFTPNNGKIELCVRNLGQSGNTCRLQFSVTDTGIGISKQAQEKLFEPFQQADGSISRRFGGTGLGLSISKNIVEQMGGVLCVESEEGEGSRFHFTISVPVGLAHIAGQLAQDIDWANAHVLVAGTTPALWGNFESIATLAGFYCASTYPLQEVEHQLHTTAPHVLFINHTAYANSLELVRTARGLHSGLHIVLLCQTGWEAFEQEARQAGVNAFLPTPLPPATIITCLNTALATRPELHKIKLTPHHHNIFAGKTILVAEDIDVNQELLLAMLENTGAQIDCAQNGSEAVEMYKNRPGKYDLILMDIHMPGMNGYEATKTIRALPLQQNQSVPIIAMTANVFKEDIENCLTAGMNDHVGKPIDLNTLLEKLHYYLQPACAAT